MIYPKLILVIIGIFVCVESAQVGHDWNYDKKGPDAWPHEFEDCKGQQQSPINVDTKKLEYDMNLKQFTYLNYATPLHWNVSHNGHTVVVSPISNAEKISIKGSDFDQEYDFLQFHFHWGFNDYHGSEHYIDSDKFPLELSKTDNKALDPLLNGVAIAKNQEIWKDATFSLSSLLPELTSLDKYYRYSGSFTTPPCTEGVKWNLFADYIEISHEQLKSFRTNDLKLNFRDPQKIYSRTVFSSFKVERDGHRESSEESGCSQATKSVFNQTYMLALSLVSILLCQIF